MTDSKATNGNGAAAKAAPAATTSAPAATTKAQRPRFTGRRTVALERQLWYSDLLRPKSVAPPATRSEDDVWVTLREYDTANAVNGAAAVVDSARHTGLSPTMAGDYLVSKLKLPIIADFQSPQFPLTVSVSRYQLSPPVRLHGDKRVVVLVSDLKFATSAEADAVVRLMAAHLFDFAARHGIARVITLDGRSKSVTGPQTVGGSSGGSGGGGGGGGGGDDDEDGDDDEEDGVAVDLDDMAGGDDDGGAGVVALAGPTAAVGLTGGAGATAPPVHVQPTSSGAGGGAKGKMTKAPSSDEKKKAATPAAKKSTPKNNGKGTDSKTDKKKKTDDDDEEDDDDDDGSGSDSDASTSDTSDDDDDAKKKKAKKKKSDDKDGGDGKKKDKKKQKKDKILFVTNDDALCVRLRSAEFDAIPKPEPPAKDGKGKGDKEKDAAATKAKADTTKPASSAVTTTAAPAAKADGAGSAGMYVRVRAWKEGTVRGVSGALLELAPLQPPSVSVCGLFASAGTKSLTDVSLSVELVKLVGALCALGSVATNPKSLIRTVNKIESKVKSAVGQLLEQHTNSNRAAQSMYA